MNMDFRDVNAAGTRGYLSQPEIPGGTIQVSGGRVAQGVWVDILADTSPDTCPFHHGPEVAGMDRLCRFLPVVAGSGPG